MIIKNFNKCYYYYKNNDKLKNKSLNLNSLNRIIRYFF
jgi:hypothetical protein